MRRATATKSELVAVDSPADDSPAIGPKTEAAVSSIEALSAIGVTPPVPEPVAPPEVFGQLALARVLSVGPAGVEIDIGGQIMTAQSSPTLALEVLRTASERGEPVLVQRAASGEITVVGALRTQATPGVDKMKEIDIEADRIRLHGKTEVTLSTSGVAQIALRAVGEIETYADRIVSRAEELHKIVGRMLRLN